MVNSIINNDTETPIATSVQPFNIQIEQNRSSVENNLTVPWENRASQEQKTRCDFCQKLVSESNYRVHMKRHLGYFPFKCEADGCGFVFSCNLDLVRHSPIHNRNERHKCKLCSASFHSLSNLRDHNLKHEQIRIVQSKQGDLMQYVDNSLFVKKIRRKTPMTRRKNNKKWCSICKKSVKCQDHNHDIEVSHEIGDDPVILVNDDDSIIYVEQIEDTIESSVMQSSEIVESNEFDAKFQVLDLDIKLLDAIKTLRWKEPTEVQLTTIPLIVEGESNVLQEAQSATGRTCATLIGLMQRILKRKKEGKDKMVAYIIAALRDRCSKIMENSIELSQFCSHEEINIVDISVELPLNTIKSRLASCPDIVISTPSVLLCNFMAQKKTNLSDCVNLIAIDQLDLLLSMDFEGDLKELHRHLYKQNLQSIFFTNKISYQVKNIQKLFSKTPTIKALHSKPHHQSVAVEKVSETHSDVEPYNQVSEHIAPFKLNETECEGEQSMTNNELLSRDDLSTTSAAIGTDQSDDEEVITINDDTGNSSEPCGIKEDQSKKVSPRKVCAICKRSVYDLSKHMLIHSDSNERSFKCSECPYSTYMKSNLRIHNYCHTNTADRSHRCLLCSAAFKFQYNLNIHMHVHGIEIENNEQQSKSDDKLKRRCDICKKEINPLLFTRHMRKHTRGKPIPCPECGFRFNSKYDLKAHSIIHSRDEPFKCDLCSASFTLLRDKRIHMLKHKNMNETRNEETTITNSNEHESEIKEKTCPVCQNPVIGPMTAHLRAHGVDKPYKCNECGAQFKKIQYLQRHMYIHTDERPFKCPKCSSTYYRLYEFKKHVSSHERM